MGSKTQDYLALIIGLTIYVGGLFFALGGYRSVGSVPSALYVCSASMVSFVILLKISNEKLFRRVAIPQLFISWLYIVLVCLGNAENATIIMGISLTVLYASCYLYIKKRSKEENEFEEDDDDDEEEDDDENAYWKVKDGRENEV